MPEAPDLDRMAFVCLEEGHHEIHHDVPLVCMHCFRSGAEQSAEAVRVDTRTKLTSVANMLGQVNGKFQREKAALIPLLQKIRMDAREGLISAGLMNAMIDYENTTRRNEDE